MSDVAWMLGGGVSHDANVPRWATAALAGDAQGVCGASHLRVTQDDTPGMLVKVAKGYVLVKGGSTDDQGMYAWYCAEQTVAIAPGDPSNPRNDIVGVQVEDDFWDASSENRARLVVVSGTPAGSPSDPALPASFVPLARVRVDQNESTSIVNGDLTDLRVVTGDAGLAVQAAEQQAAITKLQGISVFGASGSTAATSGTTPLTVATVTFTAPANGVVRAGFTIHATKSVAGDRFDVALTVNGVAIASSFSTISATGYQPYVAEYQTAVSAGSVTVAVVAARVGGGSGTLTIAGGGPSRLSGIYIPNV